jgi:hypothetical protein
MKRLIISVGVTIAFLTLGSSSIPVQAHNAR